MILALQYENEIRTKPFGSQAMANVDTYFLQPFKTHRKRLVPGQIASRIKHHALNDGARLGRTAEGVAVIHVTADDETGEISALEVLARHGVIPEEFEEQIRAL
jgi:hypothetical protein